MGIEPAFLRYGPVWPVTPLGPLPSEGADPTPILPEGALEPGAREALERWWLADQNPAVTTGPAEPLGPSPVSAGAVRRRNWTIVAIAASLIFHAAVAVFFLEGNEAVLIEGSENAGVTMLGNASEDQVSSGEAFEDATNVTLIETVTARPVETVAAEIAPVPESVEGVATEAVEVAVTETVRAETPQIEATTPTEPAIAETTQPTEVVRETTPAPDAEAAEIVPPAPASPVPEVLASVDLAPEEVLTAVPPAAQLADAPAVTEPTEAITEAVTAVVPDVVRETVEEFVETPNEVAAVPERRPEPRVERPAKPEPKKAVEQETKPAAKKPVERKAAAKPEPKAAERPAAKARSKAGSGGNNAGDARRGAADGEASGTTAAAGKKGKTSTAGNASVSNYPGKVVSKLRRALRYPAEARAKRLKGEVQVAFTVSANGSVGGIRVVRSSGSPVLDKAAIDTVRRAAPFPAIPDGRANWPFTVPLAFVR
ncbi:MAG: TonB family protein [Rhizobiaceae bacterium]